LRTAEDILTALTERGIWLTSNGNKLIVEPVSKLTDADRQAIRSHKDELLNLLLAGHCADLDGEHYERDCALGHGYEVVAPEPVAPSAPSRPEPADPQVVRGNSAHRG
jgi:hypothetical protein